MNEPEDRYAGALRDVLHAETEKVAPAGDGLARIRSRVAERRVSWWTRPALGLVGAAALGTATYVGVALATGGGGVATLQQHEHPATQPPVTSTPSLVLPASPTPKPATAKVVGIWPFQTSSDVSTWQQSSTGGHQPWHYDAGQTAVAFLAFLGHPEVHQVMSVIDHGYATAVTVGQHNADSGRTTKVTVVWLKQVGTGSPQPWDVQEATASDLTIDQPSRFAHVSTPLIVSGLITGIDESITVQLVSPSTGADLNTTTPHVPAGGTNTPWETRLTLRASNDKVGILVAYTGGHVAAVERLTVTGVELR